MPPDDPYDDQSGQPADMSGTLFENVRPDGAQDESGAVSISAGSVGSLLCATRMRAGQDLQQIAELLRIRYGYLVAIEDGRYEDLPGQAYAVGFVRAYADFLGLDGEEVVRRLREETAGQTRASTFEFPIPSADSGLPNGALLVIAILLGMVVYSAWFSFAGSDRNAMALIREVPDRLAGLVGDEALFSEAGGAAVAVAESAAVEAVPPVAVVAPVAAPRTAEEEVPQVAGELTESDTAEAEAPALVEGPAQPEPMETAPAEVARAEPEPVPQPAPVEETVPAAEPETPDVVADAVDEPPVSPVEPVIAEPVEPADVPPLPEPKAVAAIEPAEIQPPEVVDAEPEPLPVPEERIAEAVEPSEANQDSQAEQRAAVTAAIESEDNDPVQTEPVEAAEEPAPVDAAEAVSEEPQIATEVADAETNESVTEETPADTQVAEAVPAPVGEPSAGDEPVADAGPAVVELRAKSDSWIQVRDGDDLLLTRLLRKGEVYRVPQRPGLTLMTGNAGGLEIFVNGEMMPALGDEGVVRRGVPLDPSNLRRGSAAG